MQYALFRIRLNVILFFACGHLISSVAFAKPFDELTAFDTFRTYESVYPDRWRGLPDYPFEQSVSDMKNEEIRYFASRFAILDDIPYVWGGDQAKIQSTEECQQCRECIIDGQLASRQVFNSCKACRSCGIDCSHLVSQVLEDAGLPVPYGSTEELLQRTADDLSRLYHVDDVGENYIAAQTGDILIFRGHVVLMLQNLHNGMGTVIHSAAFKKGSLFGGITIEDINLQKFAGGIRRILRHHELVELSRGAHRILAGESRKHIEVASRRIDPARLWNYHSDFSRDPVGSYDAVSLSSSRKTLSH